jgi:hypothetical protein
MAKVEIEKYLTAYLADISVEEYNKAVSEVQSAITQGVAAYAELKQKVQSDSNKIFARNFNTKVASQFSEESGGNLGLHNYWYINLGSIERGYSSNYRRWKRW